MNLTAECLRRGCTLSMVDCADEERRDRCRAGDCTWHVGGRRPGWVASFLACIYVVVVLGYYPPKDRPYRAVGWVQVASHFFGRSVTLFCFFCWVFIYFRFFQNIFNFICFFLPFIYFGLGCFVLPAVSLLRSLACLTCLHRSHLHL